MKYVFTFAVVLGLSLPALAPAQTAEGPSRAMILPVGGSYLGVFVAEVDADRAKALRLPDERGVEITHVERDSPADKAGIRNGDVVLSYEGQRIEGMEQFRRLIRETPAGRHATLTVFRNGAPQTLTVVIGAAKAQTFTFRAMPAIPANGEFPGPVMVPDLPKIFAGSKSVMLGVETEPLSPQLAKFFGVSRGVLIRTVLPGTAAEKAGLRAGDVITKADDSEIDSPWNLSVAVRTAVANKHPLALQLVRNKEPLSFTVPLDHQ
jgi:serine protease Do